MLEFLGASENIVFVIALAIMLLVGIVEAIGLGTSALDHDIDIDADWLSWLGVGTLPLLMLLVIFLAAFGVTGLVAQQIAHDLLGHLIPPLLAVPAAAALALPITGGGARLLARVIPRDETTAIDIGDLVGLHAQIIVGTASAGSPAKARVKDHHGQVHYVMAEPDSPAARFAEGDEILLVRREGHVFRAISSDRSSFSNWITS